MTKLIDVIIACLVITGVYLAVLLVLCKLYDYLNNMKPDKKNKKKLFHLLVVFTDTDGQRRERTANVHAYSEHAARRCVMDYHLNLKHQVQLISTKTTEV